MHKRHFPHGEQMSKLGTITTVWRGTKMDHNRALQQQQQHLPLWSRLHEVWGDPSVGSLTLACITHNISILLKIIIPQSLISTSQCFYSVLCTFLWSPPIRLYYAHISAVCQTTNQIVTNGFPLQFQHFSSQFSSPFCIFSVVYSHDSERSFLSSIWYAKPSSIHLLLPPSCIKEKEKEPMSEELCWTAVAKRTAQAVGQPCWKRWGQTTQVVQTH